MKKFPKYAGLCFNGEPVSMVRLAKKCKNYKWAIYYKDAGNWEIKVQWKQGKLTSYGFEQEAKSLENRFLKEVTKQQWEEDNNGYV